MAKFIAVECNQNFLIVKHGAQMTEFFLSIFYAMIKVYKDDTSSDLLNMGVKFSPSKPNDSLLNRETFKEIVK